MKKIYIENLEKILINKDLINTFSIYKQKKEQSQKAFSYLYEILLNYKVNLMNEELTFNEYGKPYLKSNKIYFNISHSKNLIAIIISDKECGIDIEYINNEKKHYDIINKFFTEKEIKNYQEVRFKDNYFYKIWTKKEAYFKFIGTGIKLKQLKLEKKSIQAKSFIYNNKKEKYYISYI